MQTGGGRPPPDRIDGNAPWLLRHVAGSIATVVVRREMGHATFGSRPQSVGLRAGSNSPTFAGAIIHGFPPTLPERLPVPRDASIKKVLVIGSGPIVIGQAAEFDYAGTQACRSLREEGVSVVLVNSNPATIMTDAATADRVYIEPLTIPFLERIIAIEKPDSLLPSLGGQTGLNLAAQLADEGILERYGVRLLGTPLSAIHKAEDREMFRDAMRHINEPVPESWVVVSREQLADVAEIAPYPCIIRPAYTLGGTGGGVAHDKEELIEIGRLGLSLSMRNQILVERSLLGWKELEYEVMRDGANNAITICNMENLDPMGVHTGDSIVVAPSQTLSDIEYQLLRSASLRIIRELGVEGGCNVQFAVSPHGFDYYVIEVNPRVSRSSALASKATGYPIARVSAKVAIGLRLDEIDNAVTKKTKAFFEPALDYCVVKIPRWPFDKFLEGDRRLGTQMKATGEVMAIDRTFEAALMKALRSLELDAHDLRHPRFSGMPDDELWTAARTATDDRLWAVIEVLRRSGGLVSGGLRSIGADLRHGSDGTEPSRTESSNKAGSDGTEPSRTEPSIRALARETGIDLWFLEKLHRLVQIEKEISDTPMDGNSLRRWKQLGFSDRTIAAMLGMTEREVRERRKIEGILPAYKMVDTCAGEFEAVTPYYYSTYHGESDDTPPRDGSAILVLGSGPIRIGQGVEFDYCSVHAVQALHDAGRRSVIINSNPETVSTDFDISDALYFDPITLEDVLNLCNHEQPEGVIVQFGGQTAVNLARPLQEAGIKLMGTSADAMEATEDRDKFEQLLTRLDLPKPPGQGVTALVDARKVAARIGYPVLVRPSFVLGGRAMRVVHAEDELTAYWAGAAAASADAPVLVDKFIVGGEAEVDLVCDGSNVALSGIMEHIEAAGVHSGDSMAVTPPITLTATVCEQIEESARRIALEAGIVGMLNIQYVIRDGVPYVLEVNPRASRTIPYISKVIGVPLVQLAVRAMLGEPIAEVVRATGKVYAVKAPVFSFQKLTRVEPMLGPEMKSTGEIMGVDDDYPSALLKAFIAAGMPPQPTGLALLTVSDRDKERIVRIGKKLIDRGYEIAATLGTHEALQSAGVASAPVQKMQQGSPSILDLVRGGTVSLLINTISHTVESEGHSVKIRRACVEQGVPCVTSLDTAEALIEAIDAAKNPSAVDCRALTDYVH